MQLHVSQESMDALVFHPRSVFIIPSCLSFSKQIKLGKVTCSIKDGPSAFASRKGMLQLSVASTKSDRNRRDRPHWRSSSPVRTKKDSEAEKSPSSDGQLLKSSNEDEIIALFRRIRSSISKGESMKTKKRNPNLAKEKSPSESVRDILQKSKKQAASRNGARVFTQRQGVPREDRKKQTYMRNSASNFKLTRLPSNFVRRSPLPSPTPPRGKAIELNNEPSAATASGNESQLPRIEEIKLNELKELAKSRGIKGYSKLKKGELLELLRS